MNYIRLTNLTNKYPQIGNYIPQINGGATLFGLYEETNKIDFKLADFSEVIPIKNVSTRFIFAVTYDKSFTQVVDGDGLKIETPLDVNQNDKVNSSKDDTVIDSFIGSAESSKRKKKRGLLGKIAATAVGVAVGGPIVAVALGIRRNQIRKKQKANAGLLNRESTPDEVISPAPNPLTGSQSKLLNSSIARRKERRDRLFGTKTNLENSTSTTQKPELIGDSNISKKRIFSDLKVINNDTIATKLFCSENYYNDLKSAKLSGNPYFINFSFKPEFIIEVNTMPLIELMDSFLDSELNNGVLMKRNNYILDGNLDFEKLVQYVNWVVSKPALAEVDTNGVIPANLLCEYEKGDFDKKSGKWSTSVKQESNTTADTSNDNTTSNTNTGTPSVYPPVGRAGTTTGEIVDVDGDSYVWLGSYWRPTRTGGGNSGGSGGSGGRGQL